VSVLILQSNRFIHLNYKNQGIIFRWREIIPRGEQRVKIDERLLIAEDVPKEDDSTQIYDLVV
jgi:uncharacterized protein YccT (UPF0319 family)